MMRTPPRLCTQSGACRGPNMGPLERNVASDHGKSLHFATNTTTACHHGERVVKEHEKLNPSFSGRSRLTLSHPLVLRDIFGVRPIKYRRRTRPLLTHSVADSETEHRFVQTRD
jgi:hypothetical protein